MPELPEVEVTRRGIEGALLRATFVSIRHDGKKLREPYPERLEELVGGKVYEVGRCSKYILVRTDKGTLLIHLGMTGHLRVLDRDEEFGKFDHFEIKLNNGKAIRLNDMRRFGLIGFIPPGADEKDDPHLKGLGPEPLSADFTAKGLHEALSNRKIPIKQALMDGRAVVGVGNIYASEVLFESGISPQRKACDVSLAECKKLVPIIQEILSASIEKGGTTIRDFEGADGKMGYFVQNLKVYGRKGEPCLKCGCKIEHIVQGQRSTYFCPKCQKK